MPLEHPGTYNGKATFKWLCLVLDRADGVVKPYFMPNSVYEKIEALQQNPDYAFDEVPMPYDLTLNIRGVKTKDVDYAIMPARTNSPLTPIELALIREAGGVQDVQREFQRAQAEKESGEHQDPIITGQPTMPEAPLPTEPPPASGHKPWPGSPNYQRQPRQQPPSSGGFTL